MTTSADRGPTPEPGGSASSPGRALVELDRAEALALLGSVAMGRIVFTRAALPVIRPVNHALVDGHLLIRTHEGAALAGAVGGGGTVVAYEADLIDPATHLGWSVIVTGFAHLVTDPARLTRYEQLVEPWVSRRMEQAVLIQLDMVSGFRMDAEPESPHVPEP